MPVTYPWWTQSRRETQVPHSFLLDMGEENALWLLLWTELDNNIDTTNVRDGKGRDLYFPIYVLAVVLARLIPIRSDWSRGVMPSSRSTMASTLLKGLRFKAKENWFKCLPWFSVIFSNGLKQSLVMWQSHLAGVVLPIVGRRRRGVTLRVTRRHIATKRVATLTRRRWGDAVQVDNTRIPPEKLKDQLSK